MSPTVARRSLLHGVLAMPAIMTYRDRPGLVGAGISDRWQLGEALRRARPGEVIELAPVIFDAGPPLLVNTNGITVRATVRLASVLRSEMLIVSHDVTVEGLCFDQREPESGFLQVGPVEDWLRLRGQRELEPDPKPDPPPKAGPGPSPTPGPMPGPGPLPKPSPGTPVKPGKPGKSISGNGGSCGGSMSIAGSGVTVQGCDFGFVQKRGIYATPAAYRLTVTTSSFHDNQGRGARDANEAISLGHSFPTSGTKLLATISQNDFMNWIEDGEVVCCKTSANTVRNNRFLQCQGGASQRCGGGNTFQDNLFVDSRGIIIGGPNARLIGNTIQGGRGAFLIQAGDAPSGNKVNARHVPATNTYLENNSGPLEIGGQFRPYPAMGTTIVNHTGPIDYQLTGR